MEMGTARKVRGVRMWFYRSATNTPFPPGLVPLHVFITWTARRVRGGVGTCDDHNYFAEVHTEAN